jgi:hypothetical protein
MVRNAFGLISSEVVQNRNSNLFSHLIDVLLLVDLLASRSLP